VTYNRRIGERVGVGAMELTWARAVDNVDREADGAGHALLMDFSVTGAGLFAPADPQGAIGDVFIVSFNNARAIVEVRRVSTTDDPSLRYYGVEFVTMERDFEREAHEVIARH
jgi:hypothetical protein